MRKFAHRLLVAVAFVTAMSQPSLAGDKAPDFVLSDATGRMVSLSDYRGKPLILHFWATWCPYCRKLQPGLTALQSRYGDSGLVVLGVSFREDKGADPQAVLERRGHRFTTLVEGDDVAATYGVRGTPTTFFIDRRGSVVGMTHTSDPEDPSLAELAAAITR
jgi:peroxiredoxin